MILIFNSFLKIINRYQFGRQGLKRKRNEMKTLRFVHFSTFYSIFNLFDQIAIDYSLFFNC